MKYQEIKNEVSKFTHPEVFYAFGNSQFAEASKDIPKDKKIYSSYGGQYGTREGLDAFYKAIEDVETRIRTECTPKEIYDYEFGNHECEYTGDDSEAWEIVTSYFPDANIKRKYQL